MAKVKEVRAVWTAAKAALGGIAALRSGYGKPKGGVAIWPDCVEVFTGSESFTARIALGIGPVRIDADDFAKLVKLGKPSDEVRVAVSNRGLRGRRFLWWNGGKVKLSDQDAPLMPQVEAVAADRFGPYPGPSVKGATTFASKGDMRPILGAVAFRDDEIVATDSYRLSREVVEAANLPGEDAVLVPSRPLAAIGGKSDEVTIASDDERVSITGIIAGSLVEWTGWGIEGQYPKYEQLFPDEWGMEAELSEDAVEAVEAVTATATAVLSVNGTVEVGGQDHRFSGTQGDGVSLAPVPVSGPVTWEDGPPEEPVRIGANPHFLRDAVKYLAENGQVRYRAISPLRPMLMDSGNRQVLLMPLRIDD